MPDTKIKDISEVHVGDNIKVVTTYEDGSVSYAIGIVSDHSTENEVVSIADTSTGEVSNFFWGGTDDEERSWFFVSEDSMPLTLEEKIGRAAQDFKEKMGHAETEYQKEVRRLAEKHAANRERLAEEYRLEVSRIT